MTDPIPTYDPSEPAHPQDADYDCSQESAQWMLRSWGRSPDDGWMTQSLIDNGVMTPAVGLVDASGAGMAGWLNQEYGEFGYRAGNDASVTFDDVASEAGPQEHPLMIGGRAFYHWVGCSGYDYDGDLLLIKNSAEGYKGVYQTMSRGQFASLGSFSMVRLTHPAAEGLTDLVPVDYGAWAGKVGSGILEQMEIVGVYPAQGQSTWLPLGAPVADIEECMASDGSIYRWVIAQNRCFRYYPG